MIASLHIQAARRGENTFPKKMFFSPPFKLADVTENRRDPFLHIMQMSSSPGILDGDRYHIKVEVEDDCHLQLHTQSYQRLFSMVDGARQEMEVHVGKGASFVYLPHPCVPQENSIFNAYNKIFLSAGATLIWGEVITCGRKLNGELFKFSKYHSKTEVFLHNKLIIKENVLLKPEAGNLHGMGMLEGFTHQAGLIFHGGETASEATISAACELLETQTDIIFGITKGPASGIQMRILGNKSEQLIECLKIVSDLLITENNLCLPNYRFC